MYQNLDTTAKNHSHYPIVLHFRNTFHEVIDLIKSYRIVIIRFIKTVIRFVLCKHSAARQSYQSAYVFTDF